MYHAAEKETKMISLIWMCYDMLDNKEKKKLDVAGMTRATVLLESMASALRYDCQAYDHGIEKPDSMRQDCGSSDVMESCSCAIPSPADSRTLGLDIVDPVAVCLILAMTTISSPLNGRSVSGYVDEREIAYQCRCNLTYTSNECCGSRDGRVLYS